MVYKHFDENCFVKEILTEKDGRFTLRVQTLASYGNYDDTVWYSKQEAHAWMRRNGFRNRIKAEHLRKKQIGRLA